MAAIKIGVCAMEKKARSKPMTEILARIMSFNEFEVVYFGDEVGGGGQGGPGAVGSVLGVWGGGVARGPRVQFQVGRGRVARGFSSRWRMVGWPEGVGFSCLW